MAKTACTSCAFQHAMRPPPCTAPSPVTAVPSTAGSRTGTSRRNSLNFLKTVRPSASFLIILNNQFVYFVINPLTQLASIGKTTTIFRVHSAKWQTASQILLQASFSSKHFSPKKQNKLAYYNQN